MAVDEVKRKQVIDYLDSIGVDWWDNQDDGEDIVVDFTLRMTDEEFQQRFLCTREEVANVGKSIPYADAIIEITRLGVV